MTSLDPLAARRNLELVAIRFRVIVKIGAVSQAAGGG
jgi:hypothetical protein